MIHPKEKRAQHPQRGGDLFAAPLQRVVSRQKAVSLRRAVCLAAALIACALVVLGCASKPNVTGKWEKLYGSDIFGEDGTVIEFQGNGNVSLTLYGALAVTARYSWDGDDRLKLQTGNNQSIELGLAMNGDEITLIDSELDSSAVFKRYEELKLEVDSVAGAWQFGNWDGENNCFGGLGLDKHPDHLTMSGDGTFAIPDASTPMTGQFKIDGNRLGVTAAGTKNGKPIRGEMGCQAVVTHTRLMFKNEQGKTMTYRRTGE